MTTRAMTQGRVPLAIVAIVAASLTISASVAAGDLLWLIGLLLVLAALSVGLHDWRWSMYGLLVYMPFSGVPIIATYPNTEWGVLLKDVLFILPGYLGFVLALRGRTLGFSAAPLLIIFGIVVIVGIQSVPKISTPLVPLVAAKVWLLYIPCLFLGYHLIRNKVELIGALRLATLAGAVPLLIGIIEAVLLDTGHSDVVYPLYGPAAQAVTQGFVDLGGQVGSHLLRVPSTFSSVFQYYDFTSFMVVITFAYWRLTKNRFGGVLWGVTIIASLSSGARAAFVLTPFLIGLMVFLTQGTRQKTATASVLAIGGSAVALVGLSASDIFLAAVGVGADEFHSGFVTGVPTALGLTQTGFGTGQATEATRFVLGTSATWLSYDPGFSESWWVKVILELGIPGLLLFGALFGWLGLRALRAHREIRDPGLLAASAALIAFLAWVFVYMTKGIQFDLDPVNVYFWLFSGVLLRLPSLGGDVAATRESIDIRRPNLRAETVKA